MNAENRKSLGRTIFVNTGVNSGCPFCRALNADPPKIGDRVRVLNNYLTGLIGEVIGDENALPIKDSTIPPDEFSTNRIAYAMPGDIIVYIDGSEYRIHLNINRDLLEPEPFSPVPDWAPPICFSYAAEVHNFVMKLCNDSFRNGKWIFNKSVLFWSIIYVLNKRLPIESSEFWNILESHGFPLKWKQRLIVLYENCKEIIRIYHLMNTGRNFSNKKKVSPFAIG
jgi:hypothetical protein